MNRVLNQIHAYCRSVMDATELHPDLGANPGARIVAAKVLGFLGEAASEPSQEQLAALLQDLASTEPERLPDANIARRGPPCDPRDAAGMEGFVMAIQAGTIFPLPSVSNLASVDSGED